MGIQENNIRRINFRVNIELYDEYKKIVESESGVSITSDLCNYIQKKVNGTLNHDSDKGLKYKTTEKNHKLVTFSIDENLYNDYKIKLKEEHTRTTNDLVRFIDSRVYDYIELNEFKKITITNELFQEVNSIVLNNPNYISSDNFISEAIREYIKLIKK